MPPRKVKRLSFNQREREPNQQVVEKAKKKEHVCTEEDIIKSFKEIGLGKLVEE